MQRALVDSESGFVHCLGKRRDEISEIERFIGVLMETPPDEEAISLTESTITDLESARPRTEEISQWIARMEGILAEAKINAGG